MSINSSFYFFDKNILINIMLKFLFHHETDRMFVVCTCRKCVYLYICHRISQLCSVQCSVGIYICFTELVNFVMFCLYLYVSQNWLTL